MIIEPDFNHFQCRFTTTSIAGISDFPGVNFAKKSQWRWLELERVDIQYSMIII